MEVSPLLTTGAEDLTKEWDESEGQGTGTHSTRSFVSGTLGDEGMSSPADLCRQGVGPSLPRVAV